MVEDEPMVASLLADSLHRGGFDASTASNAVEARDQVRNTDPDAALIDINLGAGPVAA